MPDDALRLAQQCLLSQQEADGHFEGRLSSNTYPTCACAVLDALQQKPQDSSLIEWLKQQQSTDGYLRLDPSSLTDREATCFGRLVLRQAQASLGDSDRGIQQTLDRMPSIDSGHWIIKLFEALCQQREWEDLLPPASVKLLMGIAQRLMPLLPRALLQRAKPPTQFAPPPDLFHTPTFQKLFVAEQHTIVPLAFLIELNTQRRQDLLQELLDWLLARRMSDGSWFRVNFITAISTIALLEARKAGLTQEPLEPSLDWLTATKNTDGGYREAVNLNVWDTTLSVIALLAAGASPETLQNAGEWLIANQNPDGGWPFSGIPSGELPSDADDTALAALALMRLGCATEHPTVAKGLEWLRVHQGKDGSWSTYVPGAGDVGCVSVTVHAIQACLEAANMQPHIDRALSWLQKSQRSDGSWQDLWLAKHTYGTANAVIALVEAGKSASEAVQRGCQWLEQAQQADGGWGEDMHGRPIPSTVEQTAWSSYALLLADPQNAAARRGILFLQAAQSTDGSWPAACVGIYWEVLGGYADPIYAQVFPLLALRAGCQQA